MYSCIVLYSKVKITINFIFHIAKNWSGMSYSTLLLHKPSKAKEEFGGLEEKSKKGSIFSFFASTSELISYYLNKHWCEIYLWLPETSRYLILVFLMVKYTCSSILVSPDKKKMCTRDMWKLFTRMDHYYSLWQVQGLSRDFIIQISLSNLIWNILESSLWKEGKTKYVDVCSLHFVEKNKLSIHETHCRRAAQNRHKLKYPISSCRIWLAGKATNL